MEKPPHYWVTLLAYGDRLTHNTHTVCSIYRIYQRLKQIAADALSRFPINDNKETTHKSTYQKKIVSEINDIEELHGGTVTINLILITQYQRMEPILMDKYEYITYYKGYFCGDSNKDLNLITYEDNIVITTKLQNYVLHWYHMCILHPGMDRTKANI